MIDYLINEREKIEDPELNIAINLNIILNCACRIEGTLENTAKGIVDYYKGIYKNINFSEFKTRKPMNVFLIAYVLILKNKSHSAPV